MKTIYQTLCAILMLSLSFSSSAQVPNLNSHPTASGVIFLDFDGHYVTGTSWNSNGPINCEGSNLNATQITEVFNRVAEDYRPFNVNITTDSTKYWSAPATRRMRVVLTISSSWYGTAGGVAFINSFTWGDNTPCFVFTALHKYNVKNISEAASHEAGHTLGLRHQSAYDPICNKTSEYNSGKGTGEISWAPIMGNSYSRNQTLWHYGSDPYGCNNMQDDLAIITKTANGLGYRGDDFGNTTSSATAASFKNDQLTINGIIERPGDVDAIRFNLVSFGRFKLDALPFSVTTGNTGANLDMEIELLNGTQTVIGVYNPATLLSAAIDTQLNAGTYFLRVQGKGNTFAPNYASLGSYSLKATHTIGTTLPVHKLELKGAAVTNRHKLDWEVVADEKMANQTLEVSTDGTNFQTLAMIPVSAREHNYVPQKANLLYYRLSIVLDNGRQTYSNVVAIRNNGTNNKPYMIGNVVTGNLSVNSPATFVYTIHDMNGRVVSKGNLSQGLNTIAPGFIPTGMYIIQYTNGDERYTEKFMKQ